MDATAVIMLVVGVVVGAAGGLGASRLRAGGSSPAPAAGQATPDPTPDAASDPAPDDAASDPAVEPVGDEAAEFKDPAGFEIAAQRRDLVDAFIGIADAVRDGDDSLWRQVTDALAAAGVTTVAPDGEPFDPERHVPVLAEPTEDAKLHQTVAATGTVGYLDGKTWLRRPEVAVYEQGSQA